MAKEHKQLMPHQQQLDKAYQRYQARYPQIKAIIDDIGEQLLARAHYLKLPPKRIIDASYTHGLDLARLQQQYPQAEILTFSLSLEPTSIDMIFANLLLPSLLDYQSWWEACLRLLKPGGVLLFSTLGALSLAELKQSMAAINPTLQDSVNIFPDMHDLGDSLLATGFADPALDSEMLYLHYSSLHGLLTELKIAGSVKLWGSYPHLYYGKQFWLAVENYYRHYFANAEHKLIASLEICYGIAFAPTQRTMANGEISIPLSQIKRQ